MRRRREIDKREVSNSLTMESKLYFAHMDEMFDIVKRVHINTGHGGRDKMMKALNKYVNVTREVVELF